MDAAEALSAAFLAAHDPVEQLRRAVMPVLAARNGGRGDEFRFRGEPLADGALRLSVTNVAKAATWTVEMTAAERRALARELGRG